VQVLQRLVLCSSSDVFVFVSENGVILNDKKKGHPLGTPFDVGAAGL
jgi:hypothetical protein